MIACVIVCQKLTRTPTTPVESIVIKNKCLKHKDGNADQAALFEKSADNHVVIKEQKLLNKKLVYMVISVKQTHKFKTVGIYVPE